MALVATAAVIAGSALAMVGASPAGAKSGVAVHCDAGGNLQSAIDGAATGRSSDARGGDPSRPRFVVS